MTTPDTSADLRTQYLRLLVRFPEHAQAIQAAFDFREAMQHIQQSAGQSTADLHAIGQALSALAEPEE